MERLAPTGQRPSNARVLRSLTDYYRLTGMRSFINTSFHAHKEQPIVYSPTDAIRAFRLGNLPF